MRRPLLDLCEIVAARAGFTSRERASGPDACDDRRLGSTRMPAADFRPRARRCSRPPGRRCTTPRQFEVQQPRRQPVATAGRCAPPARRSVTGSWPSAARSAASGPSASGVVVPAVANSEAAAPTASPRRAPGRRREAQLAQHVVAGLHQLRAFLDQPMAAARLRRVDGAGDREDLAPALERHARGDQRARLERGLHHQRAARDAGDQAVAAREVVGQRAACPADIRWRPGPARRCAASGRRGAPDRRDPGRCRRTPPCCPAPASPPSCAAPSMPMRQAGDDGQPALTQEAARTRGRCPCPAAWRCGCPRWRRWARTAARRGRSVNSSSGGSAVSSSSAGIARVAQRDDVARHVGGGGVQPATGGVEQAASRRRAASARWTTSAAGQRQQDGFVGGQHALGRTRARPAAGARWRGRRRAWCPAAARRRVRRGTAWAHLAGQEQVAAGAMRGTARPRRRTERSVRSARSPRLRAA